MATNHLQFRALIFSIFAVFPLNAFLSNHVRDVDTSGSLTHKQITENAVRRAAVLYMNDHPDKYPDHESAMAKNSFTNALSVFKDAAAAPGVTPPFDDDPIVHFNSELIVQGNQRLLSERAKVIQAITGEDWSGAREFTGGLLHSLQDFYSNTNWVELGHDEIHPALGQPGQAYYLGYVAELSMPTCANCDTPDYSTCTNNILNAIIGDNILTSGYRKLPESYPLNPADYKPSGRNKCSHGGPSDITVDIPGTGGINKDSNVGTLSPHHYLHPKAAELAEEASLSFLKAIREIRTEDEFAQYIGLVTGTSLCFVVDTTGSMANEIAVVREETIRITIDRAGSDDAPSEYVLAPFNDPYFGPLTKTTSPLTMVEALSNLTANGGGDGPELAFGGIILAINNVRPGSTCYGFTDAPAKDVHLQDTAIALAADKDVTIDMLLTAYSRRSTNDNQQTQDQNEVEKGADTRSYSDYDRITRETGGQVIPTSKSQIEEVIKIIDATLSTMEVTIVQRDSLPSGAITTIPVDQTVTNVIISISATSTILSVDITDPTGTNQLPGAPDSGAIVELITDTTMTKTYAIASPLAGAWTVTVSNSGTSSIKVTADSTVDFRVKFVEKVPYGFGYRALAGKPLKGVENIIVVETFGGSSSSGLKDADDLVLVSADGTELNRIALYELVALSEYEAAFILPDIGFRMVFEGKDNAGQTVQRWDTLLTRTAQSVISVTENTVLKAGETVDVNITVTNKGPADTYSLMVQDGNGYFVSLHPSALALSSDESRTAVATFSAPPDLAPGQVSTVSVTATNVGGDDYNSAVFRLSTEVMDVDTTAPECTIQMSVGDCWASFYDGTPCHSDFWYINFNASDNVGLFNIKPSETHAGSEFLLEGFTSGSAVAQGNYTSDCCVPSVTIAASDALGNVGRCVVEHKNTNTPENGAVGHKASVVDVVVVICGLFLCMFWE